MASVGYAAARRGYRLVVFQSVLMRKETIMRDLLKIAFAVVGVFVGYNLGQAFGNGIFQR